MPRRPAVQKGDAVWWHRGRWEVLNVTARRRVLVSDGLQEGVLLAEQLLWEESLDGWLVWEEGDDAWG